METLLQDIRYALRGLRRSPGFTLVAVLTLALGIGVNSSIFGLVNAILFRPLPVERPGELVEIYSRPATSPDHQTHSYPDYLDYRASTRTLSAAIAYSNFFAHFSTPASSALVVGELVTDNYFSALGVRPVRGRAFRPEEFTSDGSGAVAIISDRFWRTQFNADPGVVGRTFRMNDAVYAVIGVAPPEFGGMVPAAPTQMWIPITMVEHVEPLGNQWNSAKLTDGLPRLRQRAQHWVWMKGRMNPGTSVEQVQAEFTALAARLSNGYPATDDLVRTSVVPTKDVRINPDLDRTMFPVGAVLLGAVALVLLVACANLANLMLARAAGRERELAVRLALGAARGRMVRQLLTESVVLALAGGTVALGISVAFARLIAGFRLPLPIEFTLDLHPVWRVLAYTLGVALATGVAFGLVPALRASRPDLVPSLKGAVGGSAGKPRRVTLRDALVVVQMAVSIVLVVAGALLVRSLGAAGRVDLGYDADHVAVMSVALQMNGYDKARGGQFLETARQRLAARPDVRGVAITSRAPLALNDNTFDFFIDGRQASAADKPFSSEGTYVDEHYAETLGLHVTSGRWFDAADRDGTRHVAVVTRAMADKYWPGADAVGREFRTRWGDPPYRVVGVVADYKVDTPGESPQPYLHIPSPREDTYAEILVRTAGPAGAAVAQLQQELRGIDPQVVFLNAGTLRDYANVRLFPVVAGAWLIGAFGLLALVVAAVGLYGVIGYSVSRRVREIGIRKALGARRASLVAMVVGEGMRLVAFGGIIGAALAVGAARALSSVLFVAPVDLPSYGIAFGVLAGVALLANVVPARRAAGVDPMVALRQD